MASKKNSSYSELAGNAQIFHFAKSEHLKKLSIIIVNFNTPALIADCLDSLYQYAPSCSFEIILIDNGSDFDIENALDGDYPNLRIISTGRNLGFSAANNLAIHNAHGEYILLLNSDTRLIAPDLDLLVDYLERNPSVGAAGPRHVDGKDRYQLSCGRFPTFVSEVMRKIWHYRLSINDGKVREYLDMKFSAQPTVDWVSGSCLLLRREVLERTGLLDERFFMYFEDLDLCRRIWKAGYQVHYVSQVTILHHGGASAKHNLMRVLTEYRRSQVYFARKYYGRFGEIAVRLLLFIKYMVNFVKWMGRYVIGRILRKNIGESFTYALLAKKITQGCFVPINSVSLEPALSHKPQTPRKL